MDFSDKEKIVTDKNKVFVVHGRNKKITRAMFSFLRAVGLEPIEWDSAKLITGKPTSYISEIIKAAFIKAQAIIVLFTPDEDVKLKDEFININDSDDDKKTASQARPNVIFEAGMAWGYCPDRTILVEVGDVRKFSDIDGLHSIRLSNSADSRQSLVNALERAGTSVSIVGRTHYLSEGDFTIDKLKSDSGCGDDCEENKRLSIGEFRSKIIIKLKTLNLMRDDIVYYAWICAVRALPFLFSEGHLEFWPKKDRQKYLLGIFNALDCIALKKYGDEMIETAIREVGFAMASIRDKKYATAKNVIDCILYISKHIATIGSEKYALDSATDVVEAVAECAQRIAVECNTLNNSQEMMQIMIDDMHRINDRQSMKIEGHKYLYGAVWNKFEKTLNEINCGYWYRVYECLFSNNFIIKDDECFMRLDISKSMKNESALEVARKLESP